jgi:hypothetical protein
VIAQIIGAGLLAGGTALGMDAQHRRAAAARRASGWYGNEMQDIGQQTMGSYDRQELGLRNLAGDRQIALGDLVRALGPERTQALLSAQNNMGQAIQGAQAGFANTTPSFIRAGTGAAEAAGEASQGRLAPSNMLAALQGGQRAMGLYDTQAGQQYDLANTSMGRVAGEYGQAGDLTRAMLDNRRAGAGAMYQDMLANAMRRGGAGALFGQLMQQAGGAMVGMGAPGGGGQGQGQTVYTGQSVMPQRPPSVPPTARYA